MPQPLIEVNKLQPTSAMAAASEREKILLCDAFYLYLHNKTSGSFSHFLLCQHALHYCNIVPLLKRK